MRRRTAGPDQIAARAVSSNGPARFGSQVRLVMCGIDRTVEPINGKVDKLPEYRQTLISAAVTGKIEVSAVEAMPGEGP